MFSRSYPYLLCGFLFLSSTLVSAQDSSCLRRVVPLIVQDKNGAPVAGLVASDLSAEFRGKPVEVLSVAVDYRPRQILILLDASGSMMEETNASGKWRLTLRLVADLLASLRQQDSVSLMVFSGKVDEVMDAGQGREAILKRLGELAPGRKAFPRGTRYTAIWDAILEGASSPELLHSGDVIYLVSDGEDNRSSEKHSRVKHKLLEQGIRVFAFLLPSDPRFGADNGDAVMRLAASTGGSLVVFAGRRQFNFANFNVTKEELFAIERTLATQLSFISRPYHVEIVLPVPVDKFRSWKLSPSRSAGDWRKDASLVYPSDLVPCQSASSPN